MSAIDSFAPGTETNHHHWLQQAHASARWPYPEPPYFAGGAELDALELRRDLTAIETDRRAWLRRRRAAGAVARPGETWVRFLVERGLVPVAVDVGRVAA